jgi:3,4-dihydroxy-9,10-secoandrosta-1,3,5(10)-triene-9,17-dione 4,5-dioxygenase
MVGSGAKSFWDKKSPTQGYDSMPGVGVEIKELGYVIIGAPDIEKWRHFGTEVMGMAGSAGPDGALYLKMDVRDFRMAVIPADKNSFHAAGWQVADDAAFNARREEMIRAGVEITEGTAQERRVRKVREFFWFTDPAGRRHEIYWGAISSFQPFISPAGVSGFVTGEMGFGHVVLATLNLDATVAFWRDVMHFDVSDIINFDMGPNAPPIRIYFMHCGNNRQHSLAIAEIDDPTGIQHLMVEVKAVDDVGYALDRVAATKTPLALSLGRHVNDNMLSFYMVTPGGFLMEYGTGAFVMDWTVHNIFEATKGSHWGHKPVAQLGG